MGQNQSRLGETAVTEKLAEQLRTMRLEHERDYLLVEKSGARSFLPHSEDVSVEATEKWTELVLSDPKVGSERLRWCPRVLSAWLTPTATEPIGFVCALDQPSKLYSDAASCRGC